MPAFTLEFEHDLFISYGCVDDQCGDNGELGWVSCFVADLKKRLSERLGRKDNFSIWKDEEQLARHVDITKQIANAIERSACLLVVCSPGYLKSDWCRRERNDFLKWVRARDASGSRVFVVERDWIEGDKPEEFQNLLGFKFWTGDPSNRSKLPRPLDKHRPDDCHEYKDQLNAVALALEAELRRLKTAPRAVVGERQAVSKPASGDTVFLAEVTDDLRPQWKKMRNELEQRGLRVVSGGTARDAAMLETAVVQALRDSRLFVQLLGQFPGQPVSVSHETYAMLQHRLAVDSGKPILQWRSPLLTEEAFDKEESEDPELARRHRQLLFGRVRAEHIEDFKRHVIAVATDKKRMDPPPRAGMVFVSFAPEGNDLKLAEELCGYFDQRGVECVIPVDSAGADPDAIWADFEQNVLSSRGWIVVFGDQKNKYWVRGQLNEINQLLCQSEKRGGAIHLCVGPPAPKEVNSPLKLVGMKLQRMKVIDCQNGFDIEKLYPFLDALSNSADGGADSFAVGEIATALG